MQIEAEDYASDQLVSPLIYEINLLKQEDVLILNHFEGIFSSLRGQLSFISTLLSFKRHTITASTTASIMATLEHNQEVILEPSSHNEATESVFNLPGVWC